MTFFNCVQIRKIIGILKPSWTLFPIEGRAFIQDGIFIRVGTVYQFSEKYTDVKKKHFSHI